MAEVFKSCIPEISAQTQRVVDLLRASKVGEIVTYEQMSAAADCDIRANRHIIGTARNRVLVDDQIHLGTVRGVGVKRLSPGEAAKALDGDLSRARRAAKRGVKKAKNINVLEVPEDERPGFIMKATLCSLIGDVSSSSSQQKVLKAAEAKGGENRAILAQREALRAIRDDSQKEIPGTD